MFQKKLKKNTFKNILKLSPSLVATPPVVNACRLRAFCIRPLIQQSTESLFKFINYY